MNPRADLLAALTEERFPAAAIEAERHTIRRPEDVRIADVRAAEPAPVDTLPAIRRRQRDLAATDPVPTVHAANAARRAELADRANRVAAAIHTRRAS